MNKLVKKFFVAAIALSVVGVVRGDVVYDTSAYVQEGLIAHWDACENAGCLNHDDSCSSWKDLTGNHADLVFPNGCVMGTDTNGVNFYNLAEDAQGNDHGCYLANCADIAQAIIDKSCTVEIVCDFASQVNDGTLFACADGENTRILWARSYSGAPDGCIATLEYLSTVSYAPHPSVDGQVLNQIRGYSFVCGATKCDIYKDGEATGKSAACKGAAGSASTASLSFGRGRTLYKTWTAAADMKLYAVRIYNRELTAEELAANAKIDRARLFNGQYLDAMDGTLIVAVSDIKKSSCRPALGAHLGYVAGQVVSFDRVDDAGATRIWSVQAYDETRGEWSEVKRGYGHCGTLTHTGGKMRLFWDVDLRLQPVCRWTFDDGTGRNDGTLGADFDLELSGSAAAGDGCLSVPKDASAYAATKSALPLASAEGVTVSGWVRNPSRRATSLLFELAENYGAVNGCFEAGYNSESRHWEFGMHGANFSVVGCDFSPEDDVMSDGQWHHCTVVYRKAAWPNIDLYIDGVQMVVNDGGYNYKNDTTGFRFANDQKFYLCHRGTENSQQADLDNVAIHSCALTPAEVVALYANEPRATSIPAMPEGTASLLVTAKRAVPKEDLPIPGFGKICVCTAGEKLSFDFTRAPYTVEGRPGKFKLLSWKLFRCVDGEWTPYLSGTKKLVEFVHPGGAVKLELSFGIPGMAVFVK